MNKHKIIILSVAIFILFVLPSCEKEISTSPPVEPIPFGNIFIDSSPRGMKIYEDGRNSGKVTPDSLNWLPEKEYAITLKNELYRDTTIYVDVVEGELREVNIDLLANKKMLGKIKCTSSPEGANIYINDSLTDQVTPYVFDNIIPGIYDLRYTKEEHRSNSKTITATSDHQTLSFLKLQDTSSWVDYLPENSPIPESYISCIDIDSNGVLWMGTAEYGLISLYHNNWKIYNSDNSPLPDNYIVDIVVDQNKTLWIATYSGLVEKNGDSWFTYTEDNSDLETNEITCLSVDRNNKLWIGSKAGLYWKSGSELKRERSKLEGEPFQYISAVALDTKDEIWIGTYFEGIGRYVDGGWKVYTNSFRAVEGRPGYNLYSNMLSTSITAIIVEDDADRVWFGHLPSQSSGPGGIATYNQHTKRFSVNSTFIPDPVINSFYYGPDLNVWICTDRGLVKWKSGYKPYFLDYPIQNVTVDRETGFVWIATKGKGLIKLKNL